LLQPLETAIDFFP